MKRFLSMLAGVTALFMVSCGGSTTPSDVAVETYDMLIAGKYEAVAENFYYNTEDPEELTQGKAMITSLLKEKVGPQLEEKGGVTSVEAIEETISEDGKSASVKLKIVYGNGTEDTEDMDLKLDANGEWKMAMDK